MEHTEKASRTPVGMDVTALKLDIACVSFENGHYFDGSVIGSALGIKLGEIRKAEEIKSSRIQDSFPGQKS